MISPVRTYSPRTLWTCTKLLSKHGMDGRERVDSEADAILVGSLTESGLHAPCFDFDFHTELRGQMVTVRTDRLTARDDLWDAFKSEIIGSGLATWAAITRGPDEPQSFDDLDDVVHIEFAAPVRLVRSSTPTHAHVYVDTEIEWSAYALLLMAMADLGLLERGFANNSLDRQMTMLIRPGLTKADLAARGIEINNYGDDEERPEPAPVDLPVARVVAGGAR